MHPGLSQGISTSVRGGFRDSLAVNWVRAPRCLRYQSLGISANKNSPPLFEEDTPKLVLSFVGGQGKDKGRTVFVVYLHSQSSARDLVGPVSYLRLR